MYSDTNSRNPSRHFKVTKAWRREGGGKLLFDSNLWDADCGKVPQNKEGLNRSLPFPLPPQSTEEGKTEE